MLRHLKPFTPGTARYPEEQRARQAERALRILQAFESQGAGWFWETDAEGCLSYITPAVEQALSLKSVQSVGALFTDLFLLDTDGSAISRTLNYHLATHTAFKSYPVRSARQSKGALWAISGQPRFAASGEFLGFTGSGIDLTEKRESQAAITKLAYSDGLTGLANRERMRGTLEHLMLTRQSGFDPTALLLIDLDRFKSVNDTLGHQVGDELLKQVAQRLTRVIGASGAVGRLGGDEFEVILANDQVRGNVDSLAKAIIQSVSQPYFIEGHPISVGCSIGVAIAPEHGRTAEELVRSADLALYSAKDAGRGLHRSYTDEMHAEAKRRKQLEDDLRSALANGEMHVAYQPVVSTAACEIVGFEALVRWTHPQRGPISPADFIPIAEDCGLIASIGEWVLRTAVTEAAAWPAPVRVAVNVSPVQFANVNFPAVVTSALASSGLDPGRLELEITEGVFLNDDHHSDQMFKALKRLGIRLALDDFGTGYSSLGYLKNAPFDKIKIDQSFVRGAIMTGNRNAAIIKAIVTLADTLGMETTAEGVEQQDEIEMVRDLGCSHIQGFVYGRPAPQAKVMADFRVRGTSARPVGHKISRAAREKVFRSAKLITGEGTADVVVRNISPGGAMLEGAALTKKSLGLDVLIELIEGNRVRGQVRWAEAGRVGLQLASTL